MLPAMRSQSQVSLRTIISFLIASTMPAACSPMPQAWPQSWLSTSPSADPRDVALALMQMRAVYRTHGESGVAEEAHTAAEESGMPQVAKLLFHMGPHKTGSTDFQRWLHSDTNDTFLRDQLNIATIGINGRQGNPLQDSTRMSNLRNALSLPGVSTIVSWEGLSLWSKDDWQPFRELLKKNNAKALLVYRAPWDRSISHWGQCLGGNDAHMVDYYNWCSPPPGDTAALHQHACNNDTEMFLTAAEVFGRQNVIVVSYDYLVEIGQDLTSYVVCNASRQLIGVAWKECDRKVRESKRPDVVSNRSPSPTAVSALALLRQLKSRTTCHETDFPELKHDEAFRLRVETVAQKMPQVCTSFRTLYQHDWDAYYRLTGIHPPATIPDKRPCFVDERNMTAEHWDMLAELLPCPCTGKCSLRQRERVARPSAQACY